MPRQRRSLNNIPLEELLKRVKQQPSGCWEWTRFKDNEGYGQIDWGAEKWGASRWAYLVINGDFPRELYVLHKCDNPSCCNPDHLFLGTQKDNIQDAISKRRFGIYTEARRELQSKSQKQRYTSEYRQWWSNMMKQKGPRGIAHSNKMKQWWADRKGKSSGCD